MTFTYTGIRKRIKRPIFTFLFIAAIALRAAASGDGQIGYTLLLKGDCEKAAPYIERAWISDSLDPLHRFLKARMLSDAQAASQMYLTVAGDDGAADSIRAFACFMLGSYHMAAGNPDKAKEYYIRGAEFKAAFHRMDRMAGDLLFLGQIEHAAGLWRIMLNGKDSISAHIGLGKVSIERNNLTEASDWFTRALVGADGSQRYLALMQAYRVSCMSGDQKAATTYRERIHREFSDGIHTLKPCGTQIAGQEDNSVPDIVETDIVSRQNFTLQVGAFGVKENALNLKRKLSDSFSDIRIVAVKQGSVTLHKVWLGQFSSEQQALAFGEKNLRQKGIRFRVITR